jgi:hypothetical protein
LSGPILAGDISAVMVSISNNVVPMRAAIVLDLATSVGIIVMTALLYVVLRGQSRIVALVALVLWLAEAMLTAVSVLALYALLPLSAEFVKAGAPPTSYYETVGVAFLGIEQHAYDLTLLFFCLGAFLWYGLFFRSRIVPRALAVWGLLAMPLVLAGTLLAVWDRSISVSFAIYIPYLPFELVTGLWLLIRGTRSASAAAAQNCGVGD